MDANDRGKAILSFCFLTKTEVTPEGYRQFLRAQLQAVHPDKAGSGASGTALTRLLLDLARTEDA